MNVPPIRGMSREGLDPAFEKEEARKSDLILEGRMLLARQRPEEAAERFARAAEIEESLAAACEAKGLLEKSWVHRFSAVSCWAQAGNLHAAITLADGLLARPDLPGRLRQQVEQYTGTLRARRAQWSAELLPTATEG